MVADSSSGAEHHETARLRQRRRPQPMAGMRHSAGLRLLANVVLFSLCVTLILTLVQLYLDYRRDVGVIEQHLELISRSYPGSLAEGLWNLDKNQLRLQLQGIRSLPDIQEVEVREVTEDATPLVVAVGEHSQHSVITRKYPLYYKIGGTEQLIGTLYVEATLRGVYKGLLATAWRILIREGAETFVVALFLIYIFHRLVTRHLFAIASFVDSYRIDAPPPPLLLQRTAPRQPDELQRVVDAFNALSDELQVSYRSLHDVNDQLARDVAARRLTEAILREREAQIRRLVDANILGIFIWDFDGQILEANDAFLRIIGYDRDDLAAGPLSWTKLTPPDWHERDVQWIQQHKLTGLRSPIEKEYFRKDGSRVPVLVGAANFEDSESQGVAFVIDLTERKRAEEALRESEERFRTLMQFSFDVYWESDAEHRFIRQEFAEGLADAPAPGSEIGKTRWEAPYLEPDEEAWRKHRETLDAHLPFRDFELARPMPDGSKRYVSVSGLPVFDKAGRFIGYRGVGRHITERKQAEEKLRESERRYREVQMELEHANRVATMGQLTASIAHEVNQPIAATITNAQAALRWLARRTPDLEEVRQALGRIVENGNRAGDVIGRIRGLLKRAPPRIAPVEVNKMILEVVALARSELVKNGISVRTQLGDGLPLVPGDRVQLQQVILNLIMNAAEAMSETSNQLRDLLISTHIEPDGVLVEVRDSGPGLPPATLEHLFNAFYTTKPGGLGMGLSICRSIIEAHGGRIWASANEPQGATFRFILPSHPG